MTKPNEPEALEPFQREERYIVIKRRNLSPAQERVIHNQLSAIEVRTTECVVVESDWPEYETVWSMIEARCTGAQPVADAGGVTDADREAADEISVALLQCVSPDTDLTHFRLSVADLFTRYRLQSVAAAITAKDAEIDRLTKERDAIADAASAVLWRYSNRPAEIDDRALWEPLAVLLGRNIAARAALSEAREAGDSLAARDRV
ncbi:hypothetical protein VH570_19420 [Sphingobium sp. HT1-2]|uniref:hypothetical protein n=1 Tax=Sphingobium sp. HT1-2 TaxID=3111640 RepID=UPI003C020B63